MAKSANRLESLISELYRKNDEYSELTGAEPNQELGKAATSTQVVAVEKKYGIEFPEDYRAFLLRHNGWKGFDEELALLSTQEMIDSPVRRWTNELQKNWAKEGGRIPAEGFVIAAADGQSAMHFFDMTKKRKAGGFDVVKWNDDEIARYPSFTAYLKGTMELVDELIEEEK